MIVVYEKSQWIGQNFSNYFSWIFVAWLGFHSKYADVLVKSKDP
jgi:hypothetical protein